MGKRILHLMTLVLITALILNSFYIVSLVVMSINNRDNIKRSGLGVELRDLDIIKPSGDWYPIINAYVDTTFSNHVKKDVDLLIYYSFGDYKKGSSTIFDPDSKYFSSFFGCYVIGQNDPGYYGFDADGSLDLDAILQVPKYDYDFLVVEPLGLESKDIITDYTIKSIDLLDGNHYVAFDFVTNSLYHQYRTFNLNYLQYGLPYIRNGQDDFYPIEMSGKLKIVKYNENITLIYYIFTQNQDMVKNWDI
jgi:hypothetical protein